MSGTLLLSSSGKGAGNSPAAGAGAGAAGAAAPAGSAVASTAAAGSGFDAILMLEELAAGGSDVGIDAGAAELGADGAEAPEAGDKATDDEDKVELDNPLAFLAGLLAVNAPKPQASAGAAESGEGGGDGSEGVDGLSAAHSHADGGAAALSILNDPGTNAPDSTPDDAAAAARAFAAQTALATTDSTRTDDKSAATRAVDMLTQTSRPAPAPADHPPIATHVRDPRWSDDFSTRVALLVNQRESMAAISLTPVDLGPVDVAVTVRDSQATIHFGAAQAETRALIEASLPKLRELLAAQGFTLMDASVSQGFTRQSRPDAPSIPRPSSVEEVTSVETRALTMNGLLDTYA